MKFRPTEEKKQVVKCCKKEHNFETFGAKSDKGSSEQVKKKRLANGYLCFFCFFPVIFDLSLLFLTMKVQPKKEKKASSEKQ